MLKIDLAEPSTVFARTRWLPEPVLDLVRLSPHLYWVGRTVRMYAGFALGARAIDGIDGRVHYNDAMLDGTDSRSVKTYASGATAFIEILDRVLAACGRDWQSIDTCLDVGCGYGRITRVLRHRFAADRIWVCDVDPGAVRFTVEEMGVNPSPVPGATGFLGEPRFDLIYLLSVLTHNPIEETRTLLSEVARALRDGGVLVFTAQGIASARDHIGRYPMPWPRLQGAILRTLATDGVYYRKYPHYLRNYGMAWHTRSFLVHLVKEVAPQLELTHYGSAELDGHQDVYAFRKRATR